MYIKAITEVTYTHVVVADRTVPGGESEYRRLAPNCWEKMMGNSWEPCYSEEPVLEKMYKELVLSLQLTKKL